MQITPSEVRDRLLEMGASLRRLYVKGCFPAGYVSAWPEILLTEDEKFGAVRQRIGELESLYKELRIPVSQERLTREAYDMEKPHPDPPSAAEITRLDECMGWFNLITHPMPKVQFGRRRVVWGKSMGIRSSKLGRKLGITRQTVRVWWNDSCEQIARELSQMRRAA